MVIELSESEVRILRGLIELRIEELGPEIHHARVPDYHDSLKQTRKMLGELLEHLVQAAA